MWRRLAVGCGCGGLAAYGSLRQTERTSFGIHAEAAELAKTMTVAEVKASGAEHDGCLVILDGYVYDLQHYLDNHPGGRAAIANQAGRDASSLFAAFHAPEVKKVAEQFKVARLVPAGEQRSEPWMSLIGLGCLLSNFFEFWLIFS